MSGTSLSQAIFNRMSGKFASSFAILLSVMLSACERAELSDSSGTPAATSVRDSAGVRIVSAGFSRDSLASSEVLHVADTLLDGSRPNEEGVVGLVALQPLNDSSLVIFSESGPSLLRYTVRGNVSVETLGHAGAEPGAYGPRSTLLPYRSDTLLLWDRDAGRLTRVTSTGLGASVLVQYQLSRLASVSGAFVDGSPIGVTLALPREQGGGVSRPPMALLRFHPDGAFRDTFAHVRGPERAVQIGRPGLSGDNVPVRSASVPFGRTTLWTVGPSSVLLHDTESCHIARHDSLGALAMRLDFHCAVEAVTEQDRQDFLNEVLSSARSPADSAARRRIVDQASFPPAKSTASGLLTDAWDRIWLRLPVHSSEDDWVWWVFDADGIPVTRFGLARQWRIVSVRERDMIAVQTDRDDAIPVVVRIELPAALHNPN